MADVTISQLSYKLPTSSSFIPFSDSGTTFKVSPSGLFSQPNNPLLVNFTDNLSSIFDPAINPGAANAIVGKDFSAIIKGGWLLQYSDSNSSWGDSSARIGVCRAGAGDSWWFSHNLDGSCGLHQARLGDRLRIDPAGGVTIPAQPGIKVAVTSQSQSNGQTILWDTIEYAVPANSFNTSTGVWTVPQSGKYLIIVNLLSQRNTLMGDWYADVVINNVLPTNGCRLYTSKSGNAPVHAQVNGSGIFNLVKNDNVKIVLTSEVGPVSPSRYHNVFCAQLLS